MTSTASLGARATRPQRRAIGGRGARRRGPIPLLACALLLAAPASAAEVWASEDGASKLELGGFYKALGAGLRLPRGLTDGTAALAAVVEQARQQLPPEAAAQLPAFEPIPTTAALSTHLARVQGRLLWGEHFDFEAAWELGATVASHPALASGAVLGGSPVSGESRASRRLVDFDPLLAKSGSFLLQHNLDRLALKVSLGKLDVVAGRQVLSWGSGKLWNPTDLLSPFSPTDFDKEVRRGVDALRLSVPLGATGLLDALWLPQKAGADQGGVLRGQLNVLGFDLSLSAAKYVSDLVLGGDFSGDAGPLGVHGEAAYTLGIAGWEEGPLSVRERFWRAVAGLEWRPLEKLFVVAEYYFNGYGAEQPEQYLSKMTSARLARGEIFGSGRHYLGLVASWAATDLLSVSMTGLCNLQDPSAMLVPMLEYSLEQQVLLRVGGFVPIGRRPDPSALQALTPADVLSGSDAFRSATSSLGLRSEYGASAFGALVQLAVHR